jgi:hypothetical protein
MITVYKENQVNGRGYRRVKKLYLTADKNVSRDAVYGAIFSFTGMGPVSFGICAKPREFS